MADVHPGIKERGDAQVVKQIAKLVDVVHAIDPTGDESYETEIALLELEAPLDRRTQIRQIAEHFKGSWTTARTR
jgi:acetolactate synthase small subunit